MNKKNTRKSKEKIAEATSGLLHNIIDYVLMNLEILGELLTMSPTDYTMSNVQRRLSNSALGIHKKEIQKALYRAKRHGWIKKDLKLTQEGKKKLKNLMPVFLPKKKWDGNWYLIVFDIPEKLRRKRDILRNKLKELGFGQLQYSVWISPINYLPLLENIVAEYRLDSYVIFSQTNKIGRETAAELAKKIWALDKINKRYQSFISEWEKTSNKKEKFFLQMKYLQILSQDPQLPQDLLPKNWLGNKANKLVKNYKLFQMVRKFKK